MIDLLVLVMMHAILALAAWLLLLRSDLDDDPVYGDSKQSEPKGNA